MENLMTDLIAEGRELCANASPGPWKYYDDGFDGMIKDAEGKIVAGGEPREGRLEPDNPNQILITRSRTIIPELCDALEAANAEVERLKDVNCWISVADRLPEINFPDDSSDSVLIAIHYKEDKPLDTPEICVGYILEGEWWSHTEHDCHSIRDGDNVTHWMPVPKFTAKGE